MSKPMQKTTKMINKEIFEKTKELRKYQTEMTVKSKEKYMHSDGVFLKLNNALLEYKIINKICIKLNIDPIYILLICLIPIIILLFTYFTFTCTMIAIIYPLYKSFKTLHKKSFNTESEDAETIKWLSYWLVYAFINNTECIFWKFLEKIKYYNLVKFIFLILCFLPQIQLSVIIYNYITSQIFDLYGEKFEKSVVEFFKRIFGGKKKQNNSIDDDNIFKRKKNE